MKQMSNTGRCRCLARTLFTSILLTTALVPAMAQQVPAAFVGAWKASWQTDKRVYEAAMNVTGTGGTWQTAMRDKNNPCAGREVPMKVESATDTEVKFLLQFSEVIQGCNNVNVTLTAGPDGKVTGVRSKYELTLVKQ